MPNITFQGFLFPDRRSRGTRLKALPNNTALHLRLSLMPILCRRPALTFGGEVAISFAWLADVSDQALC